jgi:hypothetical protein
MMPLPQIAAKQSFRQRVSPTAGDSAYRGHDGRNPSAVAAPATGQPRNAAFATAAICVAPL